MFNKLVKYFLEHRLITFIFLIAFVVMGITYSPFNWKTGMIPRDPIERRIRNSHHHEGNQKDKGNQPVLEKIFDEFIKHMIGSPLNPNLTPNPSP